MTKPKWLDRTLLRGPYLTVVNSEKLWRKAVTRLKIDPATAGEWLPAKMAAVTHSFTKTGQITCIVAVAPDLAKDLITATMIHEAVHIWQTTADHTSLDGRQTSWGRESEAYAIENIACELIDEAHRLRKERKK